VVPGPVPRGAPGGALRRALLAAAALLLLLALGFCVLPLVQDPHAVPAVVHGRAASQVNGSGLLRAGAAKVRIPLGPEPILAGYPGHRRAAQAGEEVFARAIALEAGGARAFIAVLDTLLIPGELEEEVLRRANLGPETCLLLAATHTHSGPGGTWDNAVAGWAGAGAFDRAQRDAIAQAAAEALSQAARRLARTALFFAREDWPQGPARARSEGRIDPELVALRLAGPGGKEIAALIAYAMHPTTVPREERRLSSDWPGRVSADLEVSSKAPVLVVQGAVGNTTWERSASAPAARIGHEAARLLQAAPPADLPDGISCETRIVLLPPPAPRAPFLLRRAARNLFALNLDRFAVQTRLRLGTAVTLVGVPGEPVGELGLRTRPSVLVGLADGYFGYLETPERHAAGGGESAKAYFGPDLARALGLWPR
jgi:hypothetical protein